MADNDNNDDTKDGEKPTGPSAEDFERMKAALHKANEEAKKYRLEAKEKDEQLDKLKAASDSSKSEMDQVREQIAELKTRAEKAERDAMVAKVAQAKKLPAVLSRALTGSTVEELEEQADELVKELGLDKNDTKDDDKDDTAGGLGRQKPRESLREGSSNEKDEQPDPKKLADSILESSL